MFHVCLNYAVLSVPCSLVVSSRERANILALLCVMFSCVFVSFPYGDSGQVWYLIVSIPDLCPLLLYTLLHTLHRPFITQCFFKSAQVKNAKSTCHVQTPELCRICKPNHELNYQLLGRAINCNDTDGLWAHCHHK